MPGSTGGSWKRSDWSGSPKWDNPTGNRGHQGFWTYSQDHATAPAPDPTQARATTSPFAGVCAVAESQPLVDDLPGHVQDSGVVVQDEAGVGGEHDPVQLEDEPVRVLAVGKLVLLERSGRESPDQRGEPGLQGRDPFLDRPG